MSAKNQKTNHFMKGFDLSKSFYELTVKPNLSSLKIPFSPMVSLFNRKDLLFLYLGTPNLLKVAITIWFAVSESSVK